MRLKWELVHPWAGSNDVKATEEQRIAVDRFASGRPLKIAAFAGAGKTTTLRLLAESRRSNGSYLAFNRSIADEANEKFPKRVDCRTTHSIAFRAIMPEYRSPPKLTGRMLAKQLTQVMEYKSRIFRGVIRLDGVHQAHLVLGTVRRYCQSDDPSFIPGHVPTYGRLLGAPPEVIAEVRAWALEESGILWRRMISRGDDVPLGHDGYLKLWALGSPKLPAEYILLDEAQDTNGVVLGVLKAQQAQIVYVGDRHQQIYEWRGAINAMETIAGCDEALLTQSFRFGAAIADAASNVLATLGETHRIRGNPAVNSEIISYGEAKTVLARTNATVILEVLEARAAGKTPCVVGGTVELKRLLSDVYELKAGKPGMSPEFFGFMNWNDVVEFADTEEGESLGMFVQLVEQHGQDKLWAAVKSAVADEGSADIILSTAHKAKGREWDSVRLASDFASSRLGKHPDAMSEVRLFYVAMTRARRTLVVAPEVLHLFGTDAWKTKEPEPRRTAGQRRAPIREISDDAVLRRPPGAPMTGASPEPRPRLSPPSAQTAKHGFWSRIAGLFQ